MYADLTQDELEALRALRRRHGAAWRKVLKRTWETGKGSPILLELGTSHGVLWLKNFRWPK